MSELLELDTEPWIIWIILAAFLIFTGWLAWFVSTVEKGKDK